MNSQTVLITGASGGIGYELTKLFARDGYELILVARKPETLEATAAEMKEKYNVTVHTIAKDLSLPQASQEIFHELQQKNIAIDILVNNAGVGVYGNFKETNLIHEQQMMQINMVALTTLTKLFLPGMIERRNGKILNVASTAAFEPGPTMAVYFATKAFVLSLSEALREELRGTGITVTTLCPGPTKTNFDVAAEAGNSQLFTGSNVMTAEAVAKLGYNGLMQKKTVVITGAKNKLMIFLLRLTPRSIVPRIVHRAME